MSSDALQPTHCGGAAKAGPDDVERTGNEVLVRVADLVKCYQIYETPQDRLKQAIFPRVQRMAGKPGRRYFREFWAVNGVSFEVRRGETLGIIGRNGSGKSTLLQMICGTLTPTAGHIELHGKVAALLELGAGFNPEFTGRENIRMNATVLGLSDVQIDARMDRIIAFADIGDFIDQPVKMYSSGMYVRVAFAVAAHVDADILVIDEALAVGDAIFSQKCMRYLRDFRRRGTLIFVSHDSGSVINLCQEAIWLDQGCVRRQGAAIDVANAYLKYTAEQASGDLVELQETGQGHSGPMELVDPDTTLELFDNIANSDGWSSGAARIASVSLASTNGDPISVFSGGERVLLTIRAEVNRRLESTILGFFVKDRLGQSLFGEHTYNYSPNLVSNDGDWVEARFSFALPLLPDGSYSMTVSIADGDPWTNVQHHWLHDAVLIRVSSPKLRYGLVGLPFDRVEVHVDRTTEAAGG